MKMFSSVTASPSASSIAVAAFTPLEGSLSLMSTTFSLVGLSPMALSQALTTSLSGSTGVLPK